MRMKSGQPTSRRPQRNVVYTWSLGKLDGFVWFSAAAAAVAAAACDDRVKERSPAADGGDGDSTLCYTTSPMRVNSARNAIILSNRKQ